MENLTVDLMVFYWYRAFPTWVQLVLGQAILIFYVTVNRSLSSYGCIWACGNECHVNSYLELHLFCLSLFQFQALRAMVRANPQILQVILWSLVSAGQSCAFFFSPPFLKGFCLFIFAAYASRIGETKPSSNETYSRASGWLSSPDQWTCWRWRGVSLVIYSCSFLEPNCACISMSICGLLYHRNISGPLAEAIPQAVQVTPEEREAIERVSHLLHKSWLGCVHYTL